MISGPSPLPLLRDSRQQPAPHAIRCSLSFFAVFALPFSSYLGSNTLVERAPQSVAFVLSPFFFRHGLMTECPRPPISLTLTLPVLYPDRLGVPFFTLDLRSWDVRMLGFFFAMTPFWFWPPFPPQLRSGCSILRLERLLLLQQLFFAPFDQALPRSLVFRIF